MPQPLSAYEARVPQIVQDSLNLVTAPLVDSLAAKTFVGRFSSDKPQEVVSDVAADGAWDLALPPTTIVGGVTRSKYEVGISLIKQIEWPIGNVPENVLNQTDWRLYRSPTDVRIRLLASKPNAGDLVRVTWTSRHASDGSTIPDEDFEAICDYIASLCFEMMAAKYAQTRDNTMNLDAVQYRTKSQEALTMAKAALKRYYDHVGVEDGSKGDAAGQGPAISLGDMDQVMGSGIDRLIHNKNTR